MIGKKVKSHIDDVIFKPHFTVQDDNNVFAGSRYTIGEFHVPFYNKTVVDGLTYCNCNYSLGYLNLA